MNPKTGEAQETGTRGTFAKDQSEGQDVGARGGLGQKTGENQGTGTRGGFAKGHRPGQDAHGEQSGQEMEAEQGGRETGGRVEVDKSAEEEERVVARRRFGDLELRGEDSCGRGPKEEG